MKQRLFPIIALLSVAATLYAGGGGEKGDKAKDTNSAREFLNANSKDLGGDGGAGKGLAILAPETSGLSAEDESENYYPSLVQGGFVTSFSKYSGLSVLDRLNLEKVLREVESGIYQDGNAYIQLGEIPNVDYIMTGTLTKTAPGRFMLQIEVAQTTAGVATKASASVPCAAAELQNLSAVNRASLDLFGQMGISLTDEAKAELLGISSEQSLEAQTALAKGLTAAGRGGGSAKTTVETLFYYSEAQSLDPSLREAAERLSAVQTAVQAVQKLQEIEKPAILQQSAAAKTGNIGADARNEVERYRAERDYEEARRKAQAEYDAAVAEQQRQRREDLQAKQRELIGLLSAAEDFLAGHPPFEMLYDPNIEQGTLDREKGTIDLSFYCATVPTASGTDVLKTILDNLQNIEKQMDEAGAQKQKWTHTWSGAQFGFAFRLLDERDTPIANAEATLRNGLLDGDVLRPMTMVTPVTFPDVDVYKISDTLRIRIDQINGVSVAEGSPGPIKVSTARFSDSSYNINGYNRQGWDRGGYYLDGYNKSGYNNLGKDRNDLTRGDKAVAVVQTHFKNAEKRASGLQWDFVIVPPFKSDAGLEGEVGLMIGLEISLGLGNFSMWFGGGGGVYADRDDMYTTSEDSKEHGMSGGLGYAGVSLHLFKHISLDMGLGYWGLEYKKITKNSGSSDTWGYDSFIIIPGISLYFGSNDDFVVLSGSMLYDPENNISAIKVGIGIVRNFSGIFKNY